MIKKFFFVYFNVPKNVFPEIVIDGIHCFCLKKYDEFDFFLSEKDLEYYQYQRGEIYSAFI